MDFMEQITELRAQKKTLADKAEALAGEGRVLVRASGTEALIRVMVEAKKEEISNSTANRLAGLIKSLKF